MTHKMTISISIANEDGQEIVKTFSEKEIPNLEEFEQQGFRRSFHQIETAVLEARKESCETAIAEYMTQISKKKTDQKRSEQPESHIREQEHPYGIESELGTIAVKTHTLIDNQARTLYNSANDLFESIMPRQRFHSNNYRELELVIPSMTSYQNSEQLLNRVRRQKGTGAKKTTVRNTVEREGIAIKQKAHEIAGAALIENGFTDEGIIKEGTVITGPDHDAQHLPKEDIMAAAEKNGINGDIRFEDYENPDTTVNISIDDVLAKRQASNRPNSSEKGKRKYVSNTVVHIQQNENTYIINEGSINKAIRLLLGFLLFNALLAEKQLVFFVDGAKTIYDAVIARFSFLPFKFILDWYHLVEKLEQRLSMGMKGRKLRNEVLDQLRLYLWRGDVTAAIKYLASIPSDQIKSQEHIDKLKDYLLRNQAYIPCYALRKELGLRNSSNTVEKSNDLIVAQRQKSNGMSWSREGSVALASVCATIKNGELAHWIEDRSLAFTFSGLAA